MKRSISFSLVLLSVLLCGCRDKQVVSKYPYPTLHGQMTYFQEKNTLYSNFKISKKDIVFVGDDLFDRGMWSSFYGSDRVKNRGIALEGTECTLYRIGPIAAAKPSKIFISSGLFDLKSGLRVSDTGIRIMEIYNAALMASPSIDVYVVGLVPDVACRKKEIGDSVAAVNSYLKSKLGNKFLGLAEELCDSTGYISPYYIVGDNRINGAGYEVIAKFLSPYVGMKALNTIFNDPAMAEAPKDSNSLEYYSSWYENTYHGMFAHYIARLSIFNSIHNTNGKTIMLGNSITNNCWWDELLGCSYDDVINRGISGDYTAGIAARLDDVLDDNPKRVFIMMGVNDFIEDPDAKVSDVWERYQGILSVLRTYSKDLEIYVQSSVPLNPKSYLYNQCTVKIHQLNSILKASESMYDYHFIDLNELFCDSEGNLDESMTADGIHLLPKAYLLWKEKIKQFIK